MTQYITLISSTASFCRKFSLVARLTLLLKFLPPLERDISPFALMRGRGSTKTFLLPPSLHLPRSEAAACPATTMQVCFNLHACCVSLFPCRRASSLKKKESYKPKAHTNLTR